MPLYRYRTFEEAEQDPPQTEKVASARRRSLFAIAAALRPPNALPGLLRFRTLEEANQHRHDHEVQQALRSKQDGVQ